MPNPAKTTVSAIIVAAIAQLDAVGQAEFSMRTLASAVGISVHALYHYFPDRMALEAAIAEESFRDLLDDLCQAVAHQQGAVFAAATAYLAFAAQHPARYALMLAAHTPAAKSPAQAAVWEFVLTLLIPVVGQARSEDVALALRALLHGFVTLTAAGVVQNQGSIEYGLAIFLAGLEAISER